MSFFIICPSLIPKGSSFKLEAALFLMIFASASLATLRLLTLALNSATLLAGIP